MILENVIAKMLNLWHPQNLHASKICTYMVSLSNISYVHSGLFFIRSLLLDKSTEIMQLKQENNAYKQKYVQAIEEKDKEILGMFIIQKRHNVCI